jgi:glycosyltransferase involved in cell wall biosynthesis
MKIAMYGQKRIPSREGGVEIVVDELSTRMVLKGHSVTCYNRKGHHVSGKEFDSSAVKEYKGVLLKSVFTLDKKGLAAMTSSWAAAMKTAFGKYDVVHVHAEGPAATCLLPKIFKKRVIVTIHGLDWQRAKWGGFATKYIKWGEKQAAKHADVIIVLSKGVQEYFRKEYGRDTTFIPNGVSKPQIRKAQIIQSEWNLKKDSYVLFLGRIVPEKGIKYLLEAWKEINTDKKLVIAGGSSDTDVFMKELKDMANENVIFTGFQQGETLEELYSNAYVYCLPSDLEGMPLSLLEAMSYGNCCLVSDIPECADVVEDKALLFEKGNVSDLRDKLQDLLADEKNVCCYKAEAADYILRKYNWDNVVEQTLEIYKK